MATGTITGMGLFTTETADNIAAAGTNCQIQAAQYAQYGRVAQVRLQIKATAALAAGNNTVAVIVAGKRPIYNAIAGLHTNHDLVGYIHTNGNVVVNGAVENSQSFTVYSTYILG